MATTQIQNTFTLGELDPLILARIDFEGYYKGARKMRDCIAIPQGGTKRRFGSLFVDTVLDIAADIEVSNPEYVRFLVFTYSREKRYLLVLRPNNQSTPVDPLGDLASIDIYLNNEYLNTIDTPYTLSQLPELRWVKASDRVLFLHPMMRPRQMVRGISDELWTLTPQRFIYYPVYDYTSLDNPAVPYTNSGVTITPSGTQGTVTLTVAGGATPFTGNSVGGLFIGNGGIARITAVASGTSATATTIEAFSNGNAIAGSDSIIAEPIWSDGTPLHAAPGPFRGWPAVGAFFQNRLFYGRTPYITNIISASTVGNYEDFDDSEALDTNGFSYALKSESLNFITNIVGTTSLIVLTTDSIFSTSPLVDLPLTPGNVFLNEQSREGSNDVVAQVVDDQVLFVDHNGKGVKSFVYELTRTSYIVDHVSILSTHLIEDPIEAAVYENPDREDGLYYLLVNEDGTLAIFNTMKSQLVKGWTLGRSTGKWVDICSDKFESYLLVKRQKAVEDVDGLNQGIFRVNKYINRFDDITDFVNDPLDLVTAALYVDVEETDDYIYICNETAFRSIEFDFETVANESIGPEFQFLDKDGFWQDLVVTDGTDGMTQDGIISWEYEDVPDWFEQDIEVWPNRIVYRKFWMRIKRTALGITTLPAVHFMFVDLSDRLFIEQLRFDYLVDCSFEARTNDEGVLSGLGELAGQSVYFLRQTANDYGVHAGIPQGPILVDYDGVVNLGVDYANFDYVVGINFIPTLSPMPPVGQFQFGVNVYLPKLVKSMFIDYFESAGLYLESTPINTMAIGLPGVNIPLRLTTGFKELQPWAGRDPRVEILIQQKEPLPFTIIGIGYKVDF